MRAIVFVLSAYILITGSQSSAGPCSLALTANNDSLVRVFNNICSRLNFSNFTSTSLISETDKALVVRELINSTNNENLRKNMPNHVLDLETVLSSDFNWNISIVKDPAQIKQNITSTLEVIERLRTKQPIVGEHELVFLEDEQMFFTTPVIFRTNYPGDIKQLESISRPDRFSDKFESFQRKLRSAGYSAELVQRLSEKAPPPASYTVIKGGTGNY